MEVQSRDEAHLLGGDKVHGACGEFFIVPRSQLLAELALYMVVLYNISACCQGGLHQGLRYGRTAPMRPIVHQSRRSTRQRLHRLDNYTRCAAVYSLANSREDVVLACWAPRAIPCWNRRCWSPHARSGSFEPGCSAGGQHEGSMQGTRCRDFACVRHETLRASDYCPDEPRTSAMLSWTQTSTGCAAGRSGRQLTQPYRRPPASGQKVAYRS